jgi:transposase
MLKRHEVEILLRAGHRKTEVARLTGVSLCSVKRIAEESPVVHVDDARERAKRKIGRPSTVANFRKQVVEILQETPDLASLEILRRVRETGYPGGKTALYALVASLRSKPAKPLVRFDGLPEEFSQHDIGQVEVEFRDGASQRTILFHQRVCGTRVSSSQFGQSRTASSTLSGDNVGMILVIRSPAALNNWRNSIAVRSRPPFITSMFRSSTLL